MIKKGDQVRVVANFECPGQDTVVQNTEARVCAVNEFDKIATIDLGDAMPVVPIDLLQPLDPSPVTFLPSSEESSTGSLRFNTGKLPVHLVPVSAIGAMADVLKYGALKYSERNWEKGHQYSVPYACLLRHLMAWWGGEDKDPESGLPHTYHVLMNAAMLVEYEQLEQDFDDRPKGRK